MHATAAAHVARPVARAFGLWAPLTGGGAASFDGEGRLLTAALGGRYFRRGLDNRVVELEREPGAPAGRWRARRRPDAEELLAAVERSLPQEAPGRAGLLLARARHGLAERYRTDARGFAAALGAVPVLPPNHARSVVFRRSEGCAWNRCRFCTLYRGVPFRLRDERELRGHVRAVLDWLGDGAGVRPHVFLGDGSALDGGVETLAAALDVVRRETRLLDRPPARADALAFKGADPRVFAGVYAFADVARAARLGVEEARALARGGLRRLYLGVESGCDRLLRALGKPHRTRETRAAVRALHAGGVAVGLLLLVGAGGRGLAAAHRAETAALLERLGLGPLDLVFLSPLDTAARAGPAAGDPPLAEGELAAETDALARELRARTAGVRVAEYRVEAFVY